MLAVIAQSVVKLAVGILFPTKTTVLTLLPRLACCPVDSGVAFVVGNRLQREPDY